MADLMQKSNPIYVLRNHLGEQAIQKAKQKDFSEVERLLRLLQAPFTAKPGCRRMRLFRPTGLAVLKYHVPLNSLDPSQRSILRYFFHIITMTTKITKTDDQWRASLPAKGAEPLAFDVTRHEATERAFTGKLEGNKAAGTYTCICCGKPLFDAATKFDSGTGWPSFFKPLVPKRWAKR